jgi:hypothetical protein
MTYVSAEYGVNEEDLREPSQNCVACEARAVIDWLSRRLESSSITDVAIYFQRESSTFIAVIACVEYRTLVSGASSNHTAVSHASGYRYSRHIGQIDAKEKNSDKLRDRLTVTLIY